ncbi:MAG TPA: site-specific DNA-methyltransferase, partial [Candidatus Pacearchaeota archaeon]|nr:site-specific DNA-methyltransferase [Candidatus Pacearchaeota archaeon]
MPSLNWIGKDKITNHDKDVPFRLMKKNQKLSLGKSENLILEGDNLEALKALMPFYYNKVKCVYIDPPYNTGNEKWIYNDKVNSPKIKEWLGKVVGPEGDDLTRHDKWLCMMYPRLKLLRDLLSDDGFIFVSIDDIELTNLRILMNEIFGEENFVGLITIKSTPGGRQSNKNLAIMGDYILLYSKTNNAQILGLPLSKKQLKQYKKTDRSGQYLTERLRQHGVAGK